jgi:hypothetical protein
MQANVLDPGVSRVICIEAFEVRDYMDDFDAELNLDQGSGSRLANTRGSGSGSGPAKTQSKASGSGGQLGTPRRAWF